MLTCREVAERADAWLDRDLSRWQAFQVRLQLAMCKGCQRFVGQMGVTRDLTEAAGHVDSTGDEDEARIAAILSRLRADKQPGG